MDVEVAVVDKLTVPVLVFVGGEDAVEVPVLVAVELELLIDVPRVRRVGMQGAHAAVVLEMYAPSRHAMPLAVGCQAL